MLKRAVLVRVVCAVSIGLSGSCLAAGGANSRGAKAGGERAVKEKQDRPTAQVDLDALPESVRPLVEDKLRRAAGDGMSDHAAAMRDFLRRRVGPGEAYPTERLMRAIEAERAEAAWLREQGRLRGDIPLEPIIERWDPIGPGNVGGRTRAMVAAPDLCGGAVDTSYMLAAGVAGGVFMSLNDGASWFSVSENGPEPMANIAVSALAIDPLDPTVVWAGTGEGPAPTFNDQGGDVPGMNGSVGFKGNGLYRGTVSGIDVDNPCMSSPGSISITWEQVDETVDDLFENFAYVNKIAVGYERYLPDGTLSDEDDPEAEPHIYVATNAGVFRHVYGGFPDDGDGNEFSWEPVVTDRFAFDVVVVPDWGENDPNVTGEIVISASRNPPAFPPAGSRPGLSISIDAGETWTRVDDEEADDAPGQPPYDAMRIDSPQLGRMSLALLPGEEATDSPPWLYVLMARNSGNTLSMVDLNSRELTRNAVVNVFRARLDACTEFFDDPDDPDSGDGSCDTSSAGITISTTEDPNDPSGDPVVFDVDVSFEAVLNRSDSAPDSNELLLSDALLSGACGGVIHPSFSVGDYANVIAVDPAPADRNNPDTHTVWVGGVDLYRSDDGGRNFGIASYWYFDESDPRHLPENQHEIVFHPEYDGVTNTTMFVAGDGGVYRTDDTTGAVSPDPCPFGPSGGGVTMAWEDANTGYRVTQFYHGDTGNDDWPPPSEDMGGPAPQSVPGRDLFAGGAHGNGLVASTRYGCTECWEEVFARGAGYVQVDPTNNDRIYFGQSGSAVTGAGGEPGGSPDIRRAERDPMTGRWVVSNISEGLFPRGTAYVPPMALRVDEDDPTRQVLWYGAGRPWRMLNPNDYDPSLPPGDPANPKWEIAQEDFADPFDDPFAVLDSPQGQPRWAISAIAVDPADPNIVYVGTENGYVFRTENGMEPDPADVVWDDITSPNPGNSIPPFVFGGYVSSIAIEPRDDMDDPEVIWLTNSRFTDFGHVYRAEAVTPASMDEPAVFRFSFFDGEDCDTGDAYDPTLPDVPANWVVLRKCTTSDCDEIGGSCIIFVGTDVGVYASDDAWAIDEMGCDTDGDGEPEGDSVTWRLVSRLPEAMPGNPDPLPDDDRSIPQVFVSSLDLRDENTIAAFTYGRGAYLGTIADSSIRRCTGQTERPCNPADLAPPFGMLDMADMDRFFEDFMNELPTADFGCRNVVPGAPPCLQNDCGDGVFDMQDMVEFTEYFAGPCS